MNNTWVDDLISVLDQLLRTGGAISWDDQSGKLLSIKVTQDIFNLIMQNKDQLIGIGKDTFMDFLMLKAKSQDFAALMVVYRKLDTQLLVAKATTNSIQLSELVKKITLEREFWMKFGISIAEKLLFEAFSVLLRRSQNKTGESHE